MSFRRHALTGAALFALTTPALAETDLLEGASGAIVVIGKHRASVDAADAEAARQPGNVSVVPAEEFEDRLAVSFRDTLAWTPGVIAQPRFGEEVRLSIRGSGLSNNSHLRGLELNFDGVPINGADGFGDFQEIDPLFASHITVLRGANAFDTGAATLGGAIEIGALTARDMESTALLRAEGGSFGTSRLHLRVGESGERFDWLLAGTWQRQDGFRAHAEQDNGRLYANLGWRWSPHAETRAGVLINDVNQEIPGALARDAALSAPQTANSNNVTYDFERDIRATRAWTRTSLDLSGGTFSFGGSYTDRVLHHPISIVIDQDVRDALLFARWDGPDGPLRVALGARARYGETDARTFTALGGGRRGALTGDSLQTAQGVDAFAQLTWALRANFDLVGGLNAIHAERDVDNRLNPAASDGAEYERASPKLGFLWAPRETVQVFGNIAGSYEPPTFNQLTQSGFVDFVPIAAQKGVTAEIGVRGHVQSVRWEAAFYEAHLKDEFASYVVDPDHPAATFNAGDTIHRGIEAFAEARLIERDSGALVARANWTWSDFHFDGDPLYGDNHLPAQPSHLLRAALAWEAEGWRISPNVEWQSGDTYVDYANEQRSPGHTIWGVEASADISPRASVFFDARNLADDAYISTVSALADWSAATNKAVFTPGDGRALYAGVRVKLGGSP